MGGGVDFSNWIEVDFANGQMFWKMSPCGPVRAGSVVGYPTKNGYLRFEFRGKTYAVHNVMWMIYNGCNIPPGFIVDHEDGNPLNNRPTNLRLATRTQNAYNSKLSAANTSGVKGVTWDKESNKWLAQCRVEGKNWKIGRYLSLEEAERAVKAFREKHHKEFANNG